MSLHEIKKKNKTKKKYREDVPEHDSNSNSFLRTAFVALSNTQMIAWNIFHIEINETQMNDSQLYSSRAVGLGD